MQGHYRINISKTRAGSFRSRESSKCVRRSYSNSNSSISYNSSNSSSKRLIKELKRHRRDNKVRRNNKYRLLSNKIVEVSVAVTTCKATYSLTRTTHKSLVG